MEHALQDLVRAAPGKRSGNCSDLQSYRGLLQYRETGGGNALAGGFPSVEARELEPYLNKLPREKAVKHAFRVASGLDSMVLGEPQILGQLKNAVKSAEHAGTLGMLLHKLFQRTFFVAKEVRSSTEIGTNSVRWPRPHAAGGTDFWRYRRAAGTIHRRR